MKTLFWISAFFLFYSYAGYPVFIWLLSSFSKHQKSNKPFFPKVSLLISAYNEEKTIEDKILNSLSLNYPKELLEIVVISDGSSDRTDSIVKIYKKQGVFLRSYEGRIGKTACLNKAIPPAKGDIIVFSDANSTYDKDAVKNLVANFADDTIGFATGYTKYFSEAGDAVSASVGIYSKIEHLTKKAESKLGSCVGADGAIFAVRKQLLKPLNDFDINDFVIPLSIIQQGLKGVFDDDAYCTERTAGDCRGEFRRQIRITSRTLRAIFNNIQLLNPFLYGVFSFELLSHKIFKFLTPFFMASLLISNVAHINGGTAYRVFLSAQAAFFLLAWLGHSGRGPKALSSLSSLCYLFVAINVAIGGGWVKFMRGETYTTWSPVKRQNQA